MTGPCHATQTVLWIVACLIAFALLAAVGLYAGANW